MLDSGEQAKNPTPLPPASHLLNIATRNGHPDVVSLLLKRGAQIDGDTVWAAVASNSIPVFQVLVDAGWDPNWSLSHCGDALTRAVIEDKVALVDWLLEHGADQTVNESALSFSTLARAAVYASPTVAGVLLDHGVPMAGSEALQCAAYYGRLDMMSFLLDRGAEVDEIVDGDWTIDSQREAGLGTALHAAAQRDHKDAVGLLLDRGATPSLKDSKGKTAFQRARKNGCQDIIQLFRTRGICD